MGKRQTSNKIFSFAVVVSPKDDTSKLQELEMQSSGSQESRARRRLLGAIYEGGCIVRKMTLLNIQPG